jgi:hypothetical protein
MINWGWGRVGVEALVPCGMDPWPSSHVSYVLHMDNRYGGYVWGMEDLIPHGMILRSWYHTESVSIFSGTLKEYYSAGFETRGILGLLATPQNHMKKFLNLAFSYKEQ